MTNMEMEQSLPEKVEKNKVSFISEYARLKKEIYSTDDENIDFEKIDNYLDTGKITPEQHAELSRMISKRDALIKQGLSDGANKLRGEKEELKKDQLTGLPNRHSLESTANTFIEDK